MEFRVTEKEVYPRGGDTFEAAEGAEIIGADWRGPRRVMVLVAEPIEMEEVDVAVDVGEYKCGAETSSGNMCSIEVDGPDERCHHHE